MIRPILPLVLVLGLAPAALAQKAQFGLQAGVAFPSGDLAKPVDSRAAFSGGLQVRVDLGKGHAVVPRIDHVRFSGTGTRSGARVEATETVTSLGADYNYYFSRKVGVGFYVGGGLGFLQKKESLVWKSMPLDYQYGLPEPESTRNRLYGATTLGLAVSRDLNLFVRAAVFADERKEDRYNHRTRRYEANYSGSAILTFGLELHF